MAGSRRDESERRTRETKDEKVDRLIRDLNRLQITIYLQVPLLSRPHYMRIIRPQDDSRASVYD